MYGIRYLALMAMVTGALSLIVPWIPSAGAGSAETRLVYPEGTTASVRVQAPVDPALMKLGQSVYADSCSICHQPNGRGAPNVFPPLADNTNIKNVQLVVTTVKFGQSEKITVNGKEFDGAMTAVGADFSIKQIAAVATYIRNSWGNEFGGVTEKEVGDILSKEKPPGR